MFPHRSKMKVIVFSGEAKAARSFYYWTVLPQVVTELLDNAVQAGALKLIDDK